LIATVACCFTHCRFGKKSSANSSSFPAPTPRARALKRLLLGHAEDCGLDASGRILLPAPLREFANLEKQVVLVGQGNKFEIWNEQAWNAWRDALLASAE
jgi:MraZ protein